ncbi:hypothetical protein [Sandarakinorhabdus glacialis]|uniref:hypothetical protein n=1 Tax=Sandarakinorhabdus glacialis TaxID=1614636 RepID=UPI0016670F21|nr:hypothetical protein [Polymorphobacter glacialis]
MTLLIRDRTLLVGTPRDGWRTYIDLAQMHPESTVTAGNTEDAMWMLAVDPRVKTVVVDSGTAPGTVAAIARWSRNGGPTVAVAGFEGGANGTVVAGIAGLLTLSLN